MDMRPLLVIIKDIQHVTWQQGMLDAERIVVAYSESQEGLKIADKIREVRDGHHPG